MLIASKILLTSIATSLLALAPLIADKPESERPSQRQEAQARAQADQEGAEYRALLEQVQQNQIGEAETLALLAEQMRRGGEHPQARDDYARVLALLAERQATQQQAQSAAAARELAIALQMTGRMQGDRARVLEAELAQHRDRLHQTRDQVLHMRELLAELEARRPDDQSRNQEALREHEQKMRQVQLEMSRLEIESERAEMQLHRLEEELQRTEERSNIESMMHRIDYVANWKDIAFESDLAVAMAVQGIVEMNMGTGDSGRAIEILSDLLNQVDDIGARTALRFAIKDVATSRGEPTRASEELRMIILENAGSRSGRRD